MHCRTRRTDWPPDSKALAGKLQSATAVFNAETAERSAGQGLLRSRVMRGGATVQHRLSQTWPGDQATEARANMKSRALSGSFMDSLKNLEFCGPCRDAMRCAASTARLSTQQ